MTLKPGIYRHYSGKLYEFIAVAHHSETLEELVVYRALYEDKRFGKNAVWVRPKDLFTDTVVLDGKPMKRFTFVSEIKGAE